MPWDRSKEKSSPIALSTNVQQLNDFAIPHAEQDREWDVLSPSSATGRRRQRGQRFARITADCDVGAGLRYTGSSVSRVGPRPSDSRHPSTSAARGEILGRRITILAAPLSRFPPLGSARRRHDSNALIGLMRPQRFPAVTVDVDANAGHVLAGRPGVASRTATRTISDICPRWPRGVRSHLCPTELSLSLFGSARPRPSAYALIVRVHSSKTRKLGRNARRVI